MTRYVEKRSGEVVDFDKSRIEEAIVKAMDTVGGGRDSKLANSITNKVAWVVNNIANDSTIQVEEIQELVEYELMQLPRKDVARAYITYRNLRNAERVQSGELMEFVGDVIDLSNVENENANMAEEVFTAKNVRMSGEVAKRYAMDYLLSADVKKAYKDMDIYIHDFTQYAVGSHNCLTIDLLDILQRGFVASNGDVRPPSRLSSAMQLTAVILQCQSNVQFGKC